MSGFRLPGRLRGVGRSEIRRLFDLAPPGSVNLGLGDPDLDPPEAVRREAARVAVEERNGYPPRPGSRPFGRSWRANTDTSKATPVGCS